MVKPYTASLVLESWTKGLLAAASMGPPVCLQHYKLARLETCAAF